MKQSEKSAAPTSYASSARRTNGVVLDRRARCVDERAQRSHDGGPLLLEGDAEHPGDLDQHGRREERAAAGDGLPESASGPRALRRIVLDDDAEGDVGVDRPEVDE